MMGRHGSSRPPRTDVTPRAAPRPRGHSTAALHKPQRGTRAVQGRSMTRLCALVQIRGVCSLVQTALGATHSCSMPNGSGLSQRSALVHPTGRAAQPLPISPPRSGRSRRGPPPPPAPAPCTRPLRGAVAAWGIAEVLPPDMVTAVATPAVAAAAAVLGREAASEGVCGGCRVGWADTELAAAEGVVMGVDVGMVVLPARRRQRRA